MKRCFLALLVSGLASVALAQTSELFVVTSNADDGSPGTLRWAINELNANIGPDADVIEIGAMTITLSSALPPITRSVVIEGAGMDETIIQAAATPNTATYGVFRFQFAVVPSAVRDLTVRHGSTLDGGGGVSSSTRLTLERVRVSENRSLVGNGTAAGGGIAATSNLVIRDSIIENNLGEVTMFTANGGGIYSSGGLLEISNSLITGNIARVATGGASGGGIYRTGGNTIINGTTIVGNLAESNSAIGPAFGGGMFVNNPSSLAVRRSTFVSNEVRAQTSVSGGGIHIQHNGATSGLTIESTTIADNILEWADTKSGGGIFAQSSSGTHQVRLRNNIIANNLADSSQNNLQISGSTIQFVSEGHNLIRTIPGSGYVASGDEITADPQFGPLEQRGMSVGPVMTLLPGSPAIDAGTDAAIGGSVIATDQVGNPRRMGPAADIGAFEFPVFANIQPPQIDSTMGDSNRRSHFIFEVPADAQLSIEESDVEVIGTYAGPHRKEIISQNNGARVIVMIPEIPEDETIGIRVWDAEGSQNEIIDNLPLDSNLVQISNIPGDIDADGTVDASELNEVILRYRGE